jgi:L-fucose isomerase-like protein
MDALEQARLLASQGYRRVSWKYRIVSRLDRPDWAEHMAAEMRRPVADFCANGYDNKHRPVYGHTPAANWEDHYRRVYSKDILEGVPQDVFRHIPSSGADRTGYLEKLK